MIIMQSLDLAIKACVCVMKMFAFMFVYRLPVKT